MLTGIFVAMANPERAPCLAYDKGWKARLGCRKKKPQQRAWMRVEVDSGWRLECMRMWCGCRYQILRCFVKDISMKDSLETDTKPEMIGISNRTKSGAADKTTGEQWMTTIAVKVLESAVMYT